MRCLDLRKNKNPIKPHSFKRKAHSAVYLRFKLDRQCNMVRQGREGYWQREAKASSCIVSRASLSNKRDDEGLPLEGSLGVVVHQGKSAGSPWGGFPWWRIEW